LRNPLVFRSLAAVLALASVERGLIMGLALIERTKTVMNQALGPSSRRDLFQRVHGIYLQDDHRVVFEEGKGDAAAP